MKPKPIRSLFAHGLIGMLILCAMAGCKPAEPKTGAPQSPAPEPGLVSVGPKHTNRLVASKSPYLLQHAHNPVDWYPWGEAAFAKARQENKPIFLSVGYSTCHWCHVMERESFENEAIAKILNEHFICIKVDREERPDVDRVYMKFVQATTGGGGWPMNVWLTPDLKPFFGGTYFPPEDRNGRRGFPSILETVAEAWRTQREQILASGEQITRQLQAQASPRDSAETGLDSSVLERGFAQIKSSYDPRHGGFGAAPKFPQPAMLNFLLRYHARTGAKDALDMTLFTLRKMADGGMHDLLGGGFHRYSVDERWHVPHFEKMLYDQAQLAGAYLDAYQITRDPFYAGTARDILDYVLRDMTGARGQFYSAEDADSTLPNNPAAHAEGAFYVWEDKEIVAALGREAADIFNYYYGVEPNGNVRDDPHGEFPKKNVLIVSHSLEETAQKFGRTPDQVQTSLVAARQKLFGLRSQRPRPHLDDKTLTAWNGLMISAFARAGQVLDEPRYREAGRKAANFIRAELYQADTGKLLRRHRLGESAIEGFVDDYAYLIQGLLDLYEAAFDINDLAWAFDLQTKQNELFWDASGGGFFSTAGNDPSVLLRLKEDHDGAEPSPNSVAALNLLRLAQMLDAQAFPVQARKTFAAFGPRLQQTPSALPQMMVALDFSLSKPKQIIIAGKPDAADTRAMLRAVHEKFLPNKTLLLADGGKGQAFLGQRVSFILDVKPMDNKATAYVCENYTCQLPTTNLDRLALQLRSDP